MSRQAIVIVTIFKVGNLLLLLHLKFLGFHVLFPLLSLSPPSFVLFTRSGLRPSIHHYGLHFLVELVVKKAKVFLFNSRNLSGHLPELSIHHGFVLRRLWLLLLLSNERSLLLHGNRWWESGFDRYFLDWLLDLDGHNLGHFLFLKVVYTRLTIRTRTRIILTTTRHPDQLLVLRQLMLKIISPN